MDSREVRPTDYDGPQHRVYRAGRSHPAETTGLWMDAVRRRLPEGRVHRLTDVGCGTGRFSVPLARSLGVRVVGVEPSGGMRAEAMAGADDAHVGYVAGAGERLPLATGRFDAAFVSMVWHHFEDADAAAAQLERVLRPGGRLFVRNAFRGRLGAIPFYRHFPAAREVDERRLPSIEDLVASCARARLELVAHDVVTQVIDASLAAHLERLRLRAISTFELIDDEQIDAGFRALEAAVRAETDPLPVTEDIDLVVFEKPAPSGRSGD